MFYDTLRTFLPAVNHTYLTHQKEVFQQLRDSDVWLSGDGRCDPPGYNAKYCSYTLMDTKTQQIVNTELVQVTDTTSSVAMEKMGFEKCVDKIEANNITVALVATDRRARIRKLIRTKYPHIEHNFDVWHFVKSLRKKLVAKAKKDCDDLTPWKQSICSHLWRCCQNCGQDARTLREMWTSILKHIVNVHSWVDGRKPSEVLAKGRIPYSPCSSRSCLKQDCFKRHGTPGPFMPHWSIGSVSQQPVEVLSKEARVYPHMQARMHLAVLDHNMNVNRKQAVVKRVTKSSGAIGTPKFTMAYSKAERKWVAKKVYEGKSYRYVHGMMADSIRGFEGRLKYEAVRNPVRPENIAKVPKPVKTILVSQLKSRFVASTSSMALEERTVSSEENTGRNHPRKRQEKKLHCRKRKISYYRAGFPTLFWTRLHFR
ncbi:hypothetical protein HOLleu_42525 [Holothuria leucospilota]|uniref:Uncharacterized protein n=1 Tax=Holothuria leucospilota TaxID=206669 RepID=A0A9Q1BC47_HOLLE|nr:hypothetical protein HOLleu_42525 [Holothuria leucospilota]